MAINHELDAGAQSDGQTFLPLSVAAASAALLAMHGGAGLVPVGAALLATLATLGALGWMARPLNMVTVGLPPLVFLLNLAAGIHLLQGRGGGARPGRAALATVGPPIFWCAATTACGFLALTTSQVRPVREMGLYGAAGIAGGALFVSLVVAAALDRLGPAPGGVGGAHPDLGARLARLAGAAARRRGLVVGASLVALALGAAGMTRLRTSLSALAFLRPGGPTRAAISWGEAGFHGFSPIEVVVTAPEGTFLDPEALARLQVMEKGWVEAAGADGSLGVTHVLRHVTMMERALEEPRREDYVLPETRADVERTLDNLPPDLRQDLGQLLDADRGRARVQLRLQTRSGTSFADAVARLTPRLAADAAAIGWRIEATGLVPMLVRMQGYLVRGFRRSFLLAGLAVLVPLFLLTGSVRDAVAAAVPNLLPVVIVLGALPALGWTLDAGTCMVASVALGIAVDDTLHLAHGLAVRRHPVGRVMRVVGPALVGTTVAGCAGFGLLGLSAFPPLGRFGVLVALTLVVALLADLALLPLLLAGPDQWSEDAPA